MSTPKPSKTTTLNIDLDRLSEFTEGIEQYEFAIHTFPVEYSTTMPKSDLLFHLYSVLQNYVSTSDIDTAICTVMVLYGVSVFKQKTQTNKFIVCFLQALDREYNQSAEVEFAIELVNAFMDDRELMRIKLA